jgi:hypothetical protein
MKLYSLSSIIIVCIHFCFNRTPYQILLWICIKIESVVVWLGPIPKLKFLGQRFGPKQNTKLALRHPTTTQLPTTHLPTTHPRTHHKLFDQFQDSFQVGSQYKIIIFPKKRITKKISTWRHYRPLTTMTQLVLQWNQCKIVRHKWMNIGGV